MGDRIVQAVLEGAQLIAIDPAAVSHVENWGAFRLCLANYSPDRMADTCGVDAELIRQAARLYAMNKPAVEPCTLF